MSKKKSPFIHLHTHSHYSLLDGLSQVDRMVKQAKKMDMPALALTDHGNLYGAIEFYKLCKKEGIKPIIGVEAYIANRTRFDKDPQIDNKRFHLTLLAKNETGYRNLLKLVSASQLEGYYYKPRMDHDLLRAHSEGLIALSGCFGGELARALQRGSDEEARRVIELYQEIFGKENYFLEIWHDPSIERGIEIKDKIVALGRELGIPLVGTQDSHYLSLDDKHAHETLLAIQTSSDMTDANRFSMSHGNYSFISTEEAWEKFADIPEAIENTQKIADMCNIELDLGKWVFPNLGLPEGVTANDELIRLTHLGLKERGLESDAEVMKRTEYELGVICDKGYAPYFLVVSDLLRHAKEQGIYTTIRGSVAGSIVTWLTGITKVNPIEYKLPFERFLNPYRPSAPDIDMDYADNRRDEMLDYVKKKYGESHVAQIGTFGTMMARGAVRDVARALGKPYALGDQISKLIPMGSQGFPMTIDNAMKLEPELKKLYEANEEVKEIIDVSKRLEGCVRHISVHAAGVVIAPSDLTDFTPLQFDPKGGKVITQYDMYTIEEAGLLKFDFLGIRNLGILADSVERVEKIRGITIDIEKIPLDDPKTFALLASGQTEGLFQLNGAAMTRYLKELRPTTIHDINAMVALFRPGPMKNIPDYIARKRGEQTVTYPHPKMKNFLENSYGILVYQDDLLYTALEVAGYNWEEVDKFRKAVGKKIPEEMAKQHVKFVDGCQKTSDMSKTDAEALWALFEPFQGYGFNKAHAACYGRVAYQTAYMKANYPAEYMTAVLTAESGDVDEVSKQIAECKRMGFEVLPPDVNESFSDFTVVVGTSKPIKPHFLGAPGGWPEDEVLKGSEVPRAETNLSVTDPLAGSAERARRHQADMSEGRDAKLVSALLQQDKIRFGLKSIKNFGEEIGKVIIRERKERGPFKDYSDFLSRIQHKNFTKKSLEALILTGALDNLAAASGGVNERGQLLANVEEALAFSRAVAGEQSNQTSLFGSSADSEVKPTFRMKAGEPSTLGDKLRWEKELLGLYVSGHPLEQYRAMFEKHDDTIDKIKKMGNNSPVLAAGLLSNIKTIITKKGSKMMFAKLEDFADNIEVVAFSEPYEKYKDLLLPDTCIAIRGTVSHRNSTPSILIEKVKKLE